MNTRFWNAATTISMATIISLGVGAGLQARNIEKDQSRLISGSVEISPSDQFYLPSTINDDLSSLGVAMDADQGGEGFNTLSDEPDRLDVLRHILEKKAADWQVQTFFMTQDDMAAGKLKI